MNRRQLLALVMKSASAAVGGILLVPALLNAIAPAATDHGEAWRPLGDADAFPVGKIVSGKVKVMDNAGSLNETGVFVWRKDRGEFIVYSRSCTDLGCPLTFDPGSEWFYCPCHGGIFDKTGERRAGPPKLPMWRYATRIRDGILEIDLRSVPAMV